MPRDYKHIKKAVPESSDSNGQLKPFITGLALGLLVAVVVFIYFDTRAPLPTVITEIVEKNKQEETVQQPEEIEPDMPEPTFEFYKILPNKEINISEWVADEEQAPKAGSDDDVSNVFVLQVGSFKDYESADRIKANLALLGITAEIQRVVINGQDIRHRVRLGPYKSLAKLKQARDKLYDNNLEHMVLRLRVGETE